MFPFPKKYAKRKKATDLPSWQFQHVSCFFVAGELLEFGAWPKSPLAPRLARRFMALDRKPPVTWWKDMAHRAVLKGPGKGKRGLIMMEYLHLLYTSNLYKSILKMGRKKGG